MKKQNPSANVPHQSQEEPLGDRGKGDKTWSPEQDEQGISNRAGDEDLDVETDEDEFEEDEEEDDASA